jgi:hypothetical protein
LSEDPKGRGGSRCSHLYLRGSKSSSEKKRERGAVASNHISTRILKRAFSSQRPW